MLEETSEIHLNRRNNENMCHSRLLCFQHMSSVAMAKPPKAINKERSLLHVYSTGDDGESSDYIKIVGI
ncbi:CLUMA_CG017704, isoform A [Clunio marinus]|uniref:CLUMA_CG017704, isoform A n=1 Tax=Clunio marinus TaxID=568069 RepID=A0A1J1IWP6_9DIPT|nr:CLUMA_CG017704, isoform A [Clunio marinus]